MIMSFVFDSLSFQASNNMQTTRTDCWLHVCPELHTLTLPLWLNTPHTYCYKVTAVGSTLTGGAWASVRPMHTGCYEPVFQHIQSQCCVCCLFMVVNKHHMNYLPVTLRVEQQQHSEFVLWLWFKVHKQRLYMRPLENSPNSWLNTDCFVHPY